MGDSKKKTRVQLDLPPASMERLSALKEKTEAVSYAEVVREAIRLYEAMLEEVVDKGNELMIRDGRGHTWPYPAFSLKP